MSDADLQQLANAWRSDRSTERLEAYLRLAIRSQALSTLHLRLGAALGDSVAGRVGGFEAATPETFSNKDATWAWIVDWDTAPRELVLRIALALVEARVLRDRLAATRPVTAAATAVVRLLRERVFNSYLAEPAFFEVRQSPLRIGISQSVPFGPPSTSFAAGNDAKAGFRLAHALLGTSARLARGVGPAMAELVKGGVFYRLRAESEAMFKALSREVLPWLYGLEDPLAQREPPASDLLDLRYLLSARVLQDFFPDAELHSHWGSFWEAAAGLAERCDGGGSLHAWRSSLGFLHRQANNSNALDPDPVYIAYERLGFTHLGDFTCSAFDPDVITAGFSDGQHTVGSFAAPNRSLIAMPSFYSVWPSGVSLTTSAILEGPARSDVLWNSIETRSLQALQDHHQQRLAEESSRRGPPRPAPTSLQGVLSCMEAYFKRVPTRPRAHPGGDFPVEPVDHPHLFRGWDLRTSHDPASANDSSDPFASETDPSDLEALLNARLRSLPYSDARVNDRTTPRHPRVPRDPLAMSPAPAVDLESMASAIHRLLLGGGGDPLDPLRPEAWGLPEAVPREFMLPEA